jgi:hypothetical protein
MAKRTQTSLLSYRGVDRVPTMPLANLLAFLRRHRRNGLAFEHGVLAHQLLEPWLREDEYDAERLTPLLRALICTLRGM